MSLLNALHVPTPDVCICEGHGEALRRQQPDQRMRGRLLHVPEAGSTASGVATTPGCLFTPVRPFPTTAD